MPQYSESFSRQMNANISGPLYSNMMVGTPALMVACCIWYSREVLTVPIHPLKAKVHTEYYLIWCCTVNNEYAEHLAACRDLL